MVLLRINYNPGTSAVVFNGTSDVPKFFFYEKFVIASRVDEEKALYFV